MGPAIGGGVGAALGLVKHNQDRAEYNRQKELAAQMQEYSPWTGVGGQAYMPQKAPSLFNDLVQNAFQGASMGSGWGGAQQGAVMPGVSSMWAPQTEDPNSYFGQQQVPTMYGLR